jgi:hypothetical protein
MQLSSQVMSPEALLELFLYAITILEAPSSLLASFNNQMFLFSTCQPTWSFIYPRAELSVSRASPQNLFSAQSSTSPFVHLTFPRIRRYPA